MRWWDTSALVAAVSDEDATARAKELLAVDPLLAVWWGTKVEGVSAISRVQRSGVILPSVAARLLAKLDALLSEALEIPPSDDLREAACRLLRVHSLRAADAFQLAAALVWAEHHPEGREFVCLDRRLREAAWREGFAVLPQESLEI